MNKANKINENQNDIKDIKNESPKSRFKEMITPDFIKFIMNYDKDSKNDKSNKLNDIENKDDLKESNNIKLTENKEENYDDICNNICENSGNIKPKEMTEHEKLKEQINKEIEDLYQLSLKNSQNKNRKNTNKNIKKEIIKPMEYSNHYRFDDDEFKENNTEFI